MFLPTTKKEMNQLGWDHLDIIFVTGDTYIDSPYTGVALLGKLLVKKGFKVGVIAQPNIKSDIPQNPEDRIDIKRLGEPRLFWGITSGSVDSMVANYTASKKWRKKDDYTPGGNNNRRPDRAVIAYTNLVRRYFKDTRPIVIGGIEASLRRIAHFDFWSNKIRRSILFDAKADILAYGMAEATVIELARALDQGRDITDIRGICYISKIVPQGFTELPSFEKTSTNKNLFSNSFKIFYANNDPVTAKGLAQKHQDRFLIQNPPQPFPTTKDMDEIYNLDFEREAHPFYTKDGRVKALDTIRFSIPTHRGCYGECNFCSIAVHEGRTVRWRTRESIINEAKKLTSHPQFKGIINDVGGPTANMYGFECKKKLTQGACQDKRCLFPKVCASLKPDHSHQIELLKQIRNVPGVKKVFIGSGVRYDLVFGDKGKGMAFLKTVVENHVSGQMKIAPEHTETKILKLMGKPNSNSLMKFKEQFDRLSRKTGKKQFLTYYLIAAHPGCTLDDMKKLKNFCSTVLNILPEQTQIFTPTPSTFSTLMYYTGLDPFSDTPVFVEKEHSAKERQKTILTGSKKKKH